MSNIVKIGAVSVCFLAFLKTKAMPHPRRIKQRRRLIQLAICFVMMDSTQPRLA
jgi:hypothetical protein